MPSTSPQDHKKSSKKTTRKSENPSVATPIPVPVDPTAKYAANTWLSGGVGGLEDLTVPSGQLCLVRRPGVEGLMKAGVLHNVDSLSQIVNEKHLNRVKGKGKDSAPDINMSSLMADPEALDQVTHVIDRVLCYVVVQPEIHMTPNDVTRRVLGVVYADMVDLVDKLHIFNFVVGGTRDIERFRGGLDELVGSLEAGEDVQDDTE